MFKYNFPHFEHNSILCNKWEKLSIDTRLSLRHESKAGSDWKICFFLQIDFLKACILRLDITFYLWLRDRFLINILDIYLWYVLSCIYLYNKSWVSIVFIPFKRFKPVHGDSNVDNYFVQNIKLVYILEM